MNTFTYFSTICLALLLAYGVNLFMRYQYYVKGNKEILGQAMTVLVMIAITPFLFSMLGINIDVDENGISISDSIQNSQSTITQDAEYSIEEFGFTIESNTIVIDEIKNEAKLLEVYSLKKLEVPAMWNNLKVDIDEDFHKELVKDGIKVYFK